MGTGVSANPISSSASDYVSPFLIILWLLSQFLLFSDWFFSFCFLFCWHFSFFLSLSFVPLVDGPWLILVHFPFSATVSSLCFRCE